MEPPVNFPNFFILGVAKSGTTSLYNYLSHNKQIYLPKDKEPHFFSNDIYWAEGLSIYINRHFKNSEKYLARGEATPAYFQMPSKVIPRMKSIYGNTSPKFIIIFRNPVERAWSHYLHMVRNYYEKETFELALELENKRLNERPDSWFGYYSDGLYSSLLKKWFISFPKERFIFFITDDLRSDQNLVLNNICSFLNVDFEFTDNLYSKKNYASEPRFAKLMKFLSEPSPLKKPFKLLPEYKKNNLKNF